ncbi:MAG: hypothetical protein HY343_06080, partial [Lentisphaerae bacterium]|nr:hypothetical protein [Lentisphaerota bacterium]
MIANHIHDALAQVRKMRELLLERQGFRGYSGTARMIGGAVALLGAAVMSADFFPTSPAAHLAGWGGILAAALALNYGALFFRFAATPAGQREWFALAPAL